jgi:hypothetical protein
MPSRSTGTGTAIISHVFQQLARRRVAGILDPDAVARFQQAWRSVAWCGDSPRSRRPATASSRCRATPAGRRRSRRAAPASRRPADGPCRRAAWRARSARPAAPRSCAGTHPGRAAHLERQDGIRAKAGAAMRCPAAGGRLPHGRARIEARRHDRPGLAAGLDIAFGGQQRIGGVDRAPGQAQLLGQRARRGIRSPGLSTPLAMAPRKRS